MSIVEEQLVIGPEHNGILMSADEFDAAEEWDELYGYELINGVLIVNPPPAIGERGPNELLGQLLRNYQDQHPQGSSLDYTVGENMVPMGPNRRRADRVIWAGLGRLPDVDGDVPTIAIEFVSSGRRNRRRDYVTKRDEYGVAGVCEYWIIDRFQRQMTVVSYADEKAKEQTVSENEIYSTPLLPGFQLPLKRLLEESDKFA